MPSRSVTTIGLYNPRVTLLEGLERLGEWPAEIWLIPPILILGAMAAVGCIRLAIRYRQYEAIAARTGLTVARKIINASEVRGTFRGRALVMAICSRQRPTFRKRWTRVTVDVTNPEGIGLQMWPQDGLDSWINTFGGTEVEVGDAVFDRRFVIRSRDARVVAKMFQDREVRDLLLEADIDSVQLLSSTLLVYYARNERDPEHAALLFTAAARLADAIDALLPDYRAEIIRVD
jgi:hypothetical protein